MVEIKGSRHVTALAFRKDKPKSYLCTTNTGLAYLSEETGGLQDLPNGFGQIIPADQAEKMRFNDAYCDSKGHFYFHSMSRDESQPKGKLYMYTSDMKSVSDLKVLEEDFAIGNGPVVDEERKRLYFNTTPNGIGCTYIRSFTREHVLTPSFEDVYDWDPETGLIRDKREFFNNNKRRPSSLFDPLTTAVGPGFPDGHTLDSAGNVYQAVFARGLIERFTPEGINDLTIKLPARFPTCPIFGGKDLKQLYITTASEALQPGEKELAGDLGGCILKVDLSEFMPQAEGLVKPLFNA